jgi:tetratricopeptide (TPR) repeat protein
MTATGRCIAAALLLMLACAPMRAEEITPLPPAVGVSGHAAEERAALFAALAATKSDAEAREVEDRLWTFWRSLGDDETRQLLEKSHEAQLRFAYAEAFTYNKAVVEHAPLFAEGWNQLGYVYFLAGDYDSALAAIERVLALEPLHYAALAGKGIILFYQGKVQDAQAPLQRALAIDPWLKERNLIGKDLVPMP